MPLTPIVNHVYKSINGLNVKFITTNSVQVFSGAARDSTNTNDIILSEDTICDLSHVGVNGLDEGVLAAFRFYTIYVIGDSTGYRAPATLASRGSLNPIAMPAGYDMFRKVATITTENALPLIVKFYQEQGDTIRRTWYDQGLEIGSGLNATSFTNIDLATGPVGYIGGTGAMTIICGVQYNPSVTGNTVEFRTGLSSATSTEYKLSGQALITSYAIVSLPVTFTPDPTIAYRVTDGSDSLKLVNLAFDDILF